MLYPYSTSLFINNLALMKNQQQMSYAIFSIESRTKNFQKFVSKSVVLHYIAILIILNCQTYFIINDYSNYMQY